MRPHSRSSHPISGRHFSFSPTAVLQNLVKMCTGYYNSKEAPKPDRRIQKAHTSLCTQTFGHVYSSDMNSVVFKLHSGLISAAEAVTINLNTLSWTFG